MSGGFIRALCLVTAIWFGWILAHFEVATECKLQGSFIVGKAVFDC